MQFVPIFSRHFPTCDLHVDRVELPPGRPAGELVGVLLLLGVGDAEAVVPVALAGVGDPA